LGAKGVKILSRKSYEAAAVWEFDNRLSSRFDGNDAVIYFDEVKVPWDRVFVHRDPAMCRAQYHETPAHVFHNHQAQVRLMVKLRFLVGMARKIADTTGVISYPQVVESLGNLAGQAGLIEGMVHGMEAKGSYVVRYYVPDRHLLYASQVQAQQMYPEVVQAIRQMTGGGVIMMPSSAVDFASAETAGYIEKTQQSPIVDAKDRVKLFKLAWDAIGSEFGSRHTQYEMFYGGAQFAVRNHSFRTYD
jgi:4-hydroxyphenylacetate 3-monooxygenase